MLLSWSKSYATMKTGHSFTIKYNNLVHFYVQNVFIITIRHILLG